ncbi:MAG TPA: alpha-galactosidase [Jatrophihabitans sp.]
MSQAVLFPPSGPTRLLLDRPDDGLPIVRRIGGPADAVALTAHRGTPLLIEHSRGSYARPGLRGHRGDGTAWSTRFVTRSVDASDTLVIEAADEAAGLELRTEVEAMTGGALRARHVLTNTGRDDYILDGLDVTVPIPDRCIELLDFTGRHERERTPQRHRLDDGLWLRETRRGRTGLEAATLLAAGVPGFGFAAGEVYAVHVADSGNSVLRAERGPAEGATIGGGELLLPGEIVLAPGGPYTSPWVVVMAGQGLDELAAQVHAWQRSLPAHPREPLVTLNVWEAVYFDHDLDRLKTIADRAARIGVERFVLDDGWFGSRRHDRAGLGDWWVSPDVWPDGLGPLVDHVRALGMQFGLWFEPEMVNPDSDVFREHPDWILQVPGRIPLEHRHQQVLDLTRDEVWTYLRDSLDAVLSAYDIGFVKWDHNRDLLEAGSNARGGAAVVHEQNLGYLRLLDDLRARHPSVAWESCASGGGRIDLGVVEHVQRFWTSDMTDALSRQQIQRWTGQLIAPEYLGAHISSPTSHQTGRTLPLDFRAATALFGSFGIEWDITQASEDELAQLASWIERFKRFRPLLHTGRVVRSDVADPSVLAHGVIAVDGSEALLAHVQLDEAASNRGVEVRVPGLRRGADYELRWEGPVDLEATSHTIGIDEVGPSGGVTVSGAALADVGIWLPRCRPETIRLIHVQLASR